MTERTARLGLELIAPGQAQKEIAHNEALALIDLGLQASVVAAGVDAPPAAPEEGRCWIVGAAPIGAWAGRASAIAGWTAGGWRFVAPREGLASWDETRRIPLRFTRGSWEAGVARTTGVRVGDAQVVGPRQPAVADAAGGATIDVEARAALAAVLAALRAHGLIQA